MILVTIPTLAVPAQVLQVSLSNQPTTLRIYQAGPSLYVDVYVNDALVIGGVVARNANLIVRSAYLGFIGDLAFIDQQGNDDPQYDGLGSRWVLYYGAS